MSTENKNQTVNSFDFAASFNHKGALFTIDTESLEGHKSSEVYKEVGSAPLLMRAIFINKDTGYGESVSVVTTNSIIYFGKSLVETAHQIRENENAVEVLNESGAWFKIVEFESKKFKKKGYSLEFLKPDEIPDVKTLEKDAPCFKW